MRQEPLTGCQRHPVQAVAFLEEMARSINHSEFVLTGELQSRSSIEIEYDIVTTPHQQQRWRINIDEPITRQIRPATA